MIEANPGILGEVVEVLPRRFEELVTDAITVATGREEAVRIAQTMISASTGLKHQVGSRESYLERLTVAVGLLLR